MKNTNTTEQVYFPDTRNMMAVQASQEIKEQFWKTTLSGSQMGLLLTNPMALWERRVLDIKPYFTNKAINKMRAGTDLEEYIIKRWLEMNEGNPDLKFCEDYGKIDKRTFSTMVRGGNTFSANIDAKGIEVKNTEEKDIEVLVKRYYPQIQYYMWFFEERQWDLVVMINGWEIQGKRIDYDNDFVNDMLEKAVAFMDMEKMYKDDNTFVPFFYWGKQDCEENSTIDVLVSDLSDKEQNLVYNLVNARAKLNRCTKLKDSLVDKCVAQFGTGVRLIDEDYKVKLSEVTRKGTVNYRKLYEYVVDKFNLNVQENEILEFTGEPTTYNDVRVNFKKDKEERYLDEEDLSYAEDLIELMF